MPGKRITVSRICEQCQSPFNARTDSIRDGGGRFCSKHCAGTFQRNKDRDRSLSEFWLHVDKPDEPDACWTWMRARDGNGYGRFLEFLAHRYTFELAYGPIPKGMFVCHTCDNPACCRNDEEGWYAINGVLRPRYGHLFLGTPHDNMTDMGNKQRKRNVSSEAHPGAKLTWDAVAVIRAAYELGTSQSSLAREYGVSVAVINTVVRHLSWKEPT